MRCAVVFVRYFSPSRRVWTEIGEFGRRLRPTARTRAYLARTHAYSRALPRRRRACRLQIVHGRLHRQHAQTREFSRNFTRGQWQEQGRRVSLYGERWLAAVGNSLSTSSTQLPTTQCLSRDRLGVQLYSVQLYTYTYTYCIIISYEGTKVVHEVTIRSIDSSCTGIWHRRFRSFVYTLCLHY